WGGTMENVMALYLPIGLFLGLAGVTLTVRGGKASVPFITAKENLKNTFWPGRGKRPGTSDLMSGKRKEIFLGILFLALWMFQMFNVVTKMAVDADDAFYMTVANIADFNGSLYRINPYSIGNMGLNYRYVLAPYPVWIAFLARISGLHTLTVGHIILSACLVSFSYLIYWQIGKLLFRKREIRLWFLVCVCVLNIWGNTSSYTSASFLLIRTRQGKGLVSGIVFPAFVWGLISMGKKLDEGERCKAEAYVLMSCILLSGCLGSAICGAILLMAWAAVHIMWAIAYRRPVLLAQGLAAALPASIFPAIYMVMR
ncbi:MAG: DUF6077 domain-containing protein, partial [Lachnospiraceae bacterium]|nr:DUF6077 domain-containing protein [Lachnospiraceae bacterium]